MTLIEDEVRVTEVGAGSPDHVTLVAVEGDVAVGSATLERLYGLRAGLSFDVHGHETIAWRLLEGLEAAALDRGIVRLELDEARTPEVLRGALGSRQVR